jgi:hypothetical protein
MVGWTEYLFGHLGYSAPRQRAAFPLFRADPPRTPAQLSSSRQAQACPSSHSADNQRPIETQIRDTRIPRLDRTLLG